MNCQLKPVTPGLTRGPFQSLNSKMKEQNGFRIKSGMTGLRSVTRIRVTASTNMSII